MTGAAVFFLAMIAISVYSTYERTGRFIRPRKKTACEEAMEQHAGVLRLDGRPVPLSTDPVGVSSGQADGAAAPSHRPG